MVVGKYVGQSQEGLPACWMMPEHFLYVRCGHYISDVWFYGLAGLGRSPWEGLNTVRHEKAPVQCPCSWLAALLGRLCCYWCFVFSMVNML